MGIIKTICAVAFLVYLWTNLFPSCSGQDKIAKIQAKPPQSTTVANAQPEKGYKSLGMTPEQFRVAFNKIISEISTDFKVAEFDIIKSGEGNDTFNRMIGEHIGILGAVNNQDQTITYITLMLGGPGASKEDILQFISVLLASTMALNPDVDRAKNSEVISSMVTNITNNPNGKKELRRLGKLNYLTYYIGGLFMFSIDSATP